MPTRYSYDSNEYNPNGDSYNGKTGSQTDNSTLNAITNNTGGGTMAPGGTARKKNQNPFNDALNHAADVHGLTQPFDLTAAYNQANQASGAVSPTPAAGGRGRAVAPPSGGNQIQTLPGYGPPPSSFQTPPGGAPSAIDAQQQGFNAGFGKAPSQQLTPQQIDEINKRLQMGQGGQTMPGSNTGAIGGWWNGTPTGAPGTLGGSNNGAIGGWWNGTPDGGVQPGQGEPIMRGMVGGTDESGFIKGTPDWYNYWKAKGVQPGQAPGGAKQATPVPGFGTPTAPPAAAGGRGRAVTPPGGLTTSGGPTPDPTGGLHGSWEDPNWNRLDPTGGLQQPPNTGGFGGVGVYTPPTGGTQPGQTGGTMPTPNGQYGGILGGYPWNGGSSSSTSTSITGNLGQNPIPTPIVPAASNDILAAVHRLLAPSQQQAQSDLGRQLNAQGALTGDINSGGYGATFGREMGNLIGQQQAQEGQFANAANENQLNRSVDIYNTQAKMFSDGMQQQMQKYGVDTNAKLQQWLDSQDNMLKYYNIDKNDLLARYQANLGLQGQMYSADQGFNAAAFRAALDYELGLTNADVSRENNIMNYILGQGGLTNDMIRNLLASDPTSIISGQQFPTGNIVVKP